MSAPLLSVVVPTRDRPAALARCLAALAAQRYPTERFEVVIVDDGGAPGAAEATLAAAGPLDARVLVQPHGGPARARNLGARAARGRLLAFTDDDCRPQPGWLAALEAALAARPGAMVGGRVTNLLSDNRFAEASQLVTDIVYAHYNAGPGDARFVASNNIAVPAADFAAAGGFDERFLVIAAEDRELCDRWIHQGRPLVYAPAAVVGHAHEMGLREYLRQHFTYGRGAVHFHRLRAGRGSGRMRDEMGFHADLGGRLARRLRGRPPREAAEMAALMLAWQAANAAGFLYERVTGGGYGATGAPAG